MNHRTQPNPDENQQRVDEHLESNEVDEALQDEEHHSGTQAHHATSKSNSEQQAQMREISQTISKKLLEDPENYRIWRVLTTIQLREFWHRIHSLENVIQNRHSFTRVNYF